MDSCIPKVFDLEGLWIEAEQANLFVMKKYHGATMAYHCKQWYTMVRCKCTMVQTTSTMVNCGIPWYNFSCTMAHP